MLKPLLPRANPGIRSGCRWQRRAFALPDDRLQIFVLTARQHLVEQFVGRSRPPVQPQHKAAKRQRRQIVAIVGQSLPEILFGQRVLALLPVQAPTVVPGEVLAGFVITQAGRLGKAIERLAELPLVIQGNAKVEMRLPESGRGIECRTEMAFRRGVAFWASA